MLAEVLGVSSSIAFANNRGYTVFTPGVETKSKQLQNFHISF